MLDNKSYVVIDEVTFCKMVDFLNTAREMASHSYDHLTAGYDNLLRDVRDRAEKIRKDKLFNNNNH